jgi:rRNA maturation endonuclease Nob1
MAANGLHGRRRYARVVLAVSWQEVAIFAAIVVMAALIYAGRPSKPRWVRICRTCGLENVADAQACERCGGRLERRDMAPRR